MNAANLSVSAVLSCTRKVESHSAIQTDAERLFHAKYVDSIRPHQSPESYITQQLLKLFPEFVSEDGKLQLGIVGL